MVGVASAPSVGEEICVEISAEGTEVFVGLAASVFAICVNVMAMDVSCALGLSIVEVA